jgi:putative YphP/YqiW family bacilliredoxin
MYPAELVAPIEKDLTDFGFKALESATDVITTLDSDAKKGTTLLVVNSVCGCAARNARPAVKQAVSSGKSPDRLVTVFAGVDVEATEKAREYLLPYPPSSPSIALFKDGELVHMIERRHIEGNTAEAISNHLVAVFDQYC